jgi:hypothetical protein
METSYKNSFYSPKFQGSTEVIKTEANPTEYKGCQIFQRIKGECWDVVKDGICIGMYAGINGAKKFIDTL